MNFKIKSKRIIPENNRNNLCIQKNHLKIITTKKRQINKIKQDNIVDKEEKQTQVNMQ